MEASCQALGPIRPDRSDIVLRETFLLSLEKSPLGNKWAIELIETSTASNRRKNSPARAPSVFILSSVLLEPGEPVYATGHFPNSERSYISDQVWANKHLTSHLKRTSTSQVAQSYIGPIWFISWSAGSFANICKLSQSRWDQ